MSIESVIPSNHLILCHPLFLLPSIFPSIRVFSNELFISGRQSVGGWASSSVLPMNIQGLFPLGVAALILKSKGLLSLLQQCSSKTSILWCSAFFMVQLSHPHMTTGKTMTIHGFSHMTIWIFVGKVMSCFINMLSRFAIVFSLRSKRLLISWLQSLSTMILETKKIKSVTVFPFCLPSSDGTRCHDLQFLNVWF